jgi:hypothetical protein
MEPEQPPSEPIDTLANHYVGTLDRTKNLGIYRVQN